jgi:hypothetical protein
VEVVNRATLAASFHLAAKKRAALVTGDLARLIYGAARRVSEP